MRPRRRSRWRALAPGRHDRHPKATQPEHVRDNFGALDLALDAADLAAARPRLPAAQGRSRFRNACSATPDSQRLFCAIAGARVLSSKVEQSHTVMDPYMTA